MKLIVETVEPNEINVLNEATEDGKKRWYISGPFMQADTKNRNGRIYPKKILEREVEKYIKEKVNTKQAMGELDHPPQTTINLERVSHLVESLKFEGNDVIGKAKILDTPCGRTVQSLLEGGVKLGVSSRGVGSLNEDTVADDYSLVCIDIVGDPSALSAYVDGIYESVDYIVSGDKFVEKAVDQLKKNMDKNGSKRIYEAMSQFLKDIQRTL
jgi:hypothetical protein